MFDEVYEQRLSNQIAEEKNPRRRELLHKGLGYGTVAYLRSIWFPTIGNLDYLYPEYEVRDMRNGCRYLDLAYAGGAKGCIEIQDYRTLSWRKRCALPAEWCVLSHLENFQRICGYRNATPEKIFVIWLTKNCSSSLAGISDIVRRSLGNNRISSDFLTAAMASI
ncbi:hypothetical protein DFP97_104235 [Paenibacillus prosopidis]|uniref:Uncharacterized protein n=2 Tax=Paenibacillus prosopidis TaxID=630520 RepID=A0A368W465_9BACL|nr:hypothetical protein DFP97_104235 [Paenibacillus prosopidis]